MPDGSLAYGQRRHFTVDNLTQQWVWRIGLAAAVALGYFLAATLSVRLVLTPDGVPAFWPGAGLSAGVLIALGPRARWPVLAGVLVGTVAAHLIIKEPLWARPLGLCNWAEGLITAGLIQHYYGSGFNLVRLRQIIGLLAAAVAGTSVATIVGAVTYRLFRGPLAPMLEIWWHWFASDIVGIIAVAPLVIGLTAIVRRPSLLSEVTESTLALVALAVMTGLIILLPRELWETMFPLTWLFPILLWLAARRRPAFSAAGAFVVSVTIVWTTILGIGHFGDPNLPITDRVLGAQAAILIVAITAYVLAALFAERREIATRLQHERDNKLMNAEAIVAAIAHEVRQPLSGIVMNADAALRLLGKMPPDQDRVRENLERIVNAGNRASGVFDGIGALFRKADPQPIDVNGLILDVLESLRGEFEDHGVEVHTELMSKPIFVDGNRNQLQEVVINLVLNAIEAMNTVTGRSRVLRVKTEVGSVDTIVATVEDSGPGIDPEKLDGIFTAFVTTKSHGMGLGLAICRMIIEHHGGQLTASSDGKSGALFQFVLPVESRNNATARAAVREGSDMFKFIARANIAHFREKLADEQDETQRQNLLCLLAEEQAKLAALENDPPKKNKED